MDNTNNWTISPGATPPLAEAPAQPPYADAVAPQHTEAGVVAAGEGRRFTRTKAIVAAGALAVAGLGAGAYAVAANRGQESTSPAAAPGGEKYHDPANDVEVCPTMYPDGPFKATQDAFPGELHIRPTTPLTDKKSVMNSLFSKDGVACNSNATISTLWALGSDLQGAGNMGTGFGSTDISKVQKDFLDDPAKAQRAAVVLEKAWANGHNNAEKIEGPMFRVGAEKTDDPTIPFKPVYVPESVSKDKNQVFLLKWNDVIGDTPADQVDKDQLIYVDLATRQIYVRKAIGNIAQAKPDEAHKQDGGGEGDVGGGINAGPHGESEQGPLQGPNNGPTNEATPGPDHTPGPGNKTPNATVTTVPGVTVTTPRTTIPPTQPPVTQPPTTTPTTRPPVTVPPTTPPTTPVKPPISPCKPGIDPNC